MAGRYATLPAGVENLTAQDIQQVAAVLSIAMQINWTPYVETRTCYQGPGAHYKLYFTHDLQVFKEFVSSLPLAVSPSGQQQPAMQAVVQWILDIKLLSVILFRCDTARNTIDWIVGRQSGQSWGKMYSPSMNP